MDKKAEHHEPEPVRFSARRFVDVVRSPDAAPADPDGETDAAGTVGDVDREPVDIGPDPWRRPTP